MAVRKEPRFVVAVIQLNKFNNVHIVAGSKHVKNVPEIPFKDVPLAFLSELSNAIRKSASVKNFPDLMAFSFWCRKGHLEKLKMEQANLERRLGRGLVFHITPSNVPLNFGYSFIFGLLSGNANIVKVPSKEFPQGEFLCKAIDDLLRKKEYESLYNNTALIKYDKENEITKYFSSVCDARIIWGGDSTIKNIRKFETPVRSVDIAFADRYSICVVDVEKLSKLSTKELLKVAELFYNDTFLMDQNACSSPHIVIWIGKEKNGAKNKFWRALERYVQKNYDIEFISVVDKYTKLCQTAIDIGIPFDFISYDNLIYRVKLNKLPENIHQFRGNCGYFYEYDVSNLDEICHIINNKYQTVTYFGLEKAFLVDFVIRNKLHGLDRIVPIGKALDIDLVWDGFEVISSLSRKINYN